MERHARIALVAAGVLLAAAGTRGALLAPRVTLHNAAVSIDHPWPAVAGWAALAAVPVLVALATRSRALRAALVLACAVVLLQAWHVAVYRLEAGPTLLEERQAFARMTIPWNQVAQVDSREKEIAVWGPGTQILIDTKRFSADQRAIIDRTIARHLREH